jgi:hypothetical protein
MMTEHAHNTNSLKPKFPDNMTILSDFIVMASERTVVMFFVSAELSFLPLVHHGDYDHFSFARRRVSAAVRRRSPLALAMRGGA